MISLIEARNFRCLRHVRQPLDRFNVLVGANGTGKSTFFDVVAFLGDLVARDLESAVRSRTQNFEDLLWGRRGECFELAIEVRLPESVIAGDPKLDAIRYQVRIGRDAEREELAIWSEEVFLKHRSERAPRTSDFPTSAAVPESIFEISDGRYVIQKQRGNGDTFTPEDVPAVGPFSFKLGPRRSALASLPNDESLFPATAWLKSFLDTGVAKVELSERALGRASAPSQGHAFKPDGSNLPWLVEALRSKKPEHFRGWLAHVQTALPELEDVRTVERADDRHRYLMLRYRDGLEVPSWTASGGTLRMLALTLLAYATDTASIYLVEEPEDGIHPRAAETVYQSLSNIYNAQLLLATHSPLILSMVEPAQLLCFAKASDGSTDIVLGSEHPTLRDWKGETNLSTLFAAGILG